MWVFRHEQSQEWVASPAPLLEELIGDGGGREDCSDCCTRSKGVENWGGVESQVRGKTFELYLALAQTPSSLQQLFCDYVMSSNRALSIASSPTNIQFKYLRR